MTIIAPEKFGWDHTALMLYTETRVVDYKGALNRSHFAVTSERYPYRLFNGETEPMHGDAEAIYDLEAAGLLSYDGTTATLTEDGWAAAHAIRRARAEGERMKPVMVSAFREALGVPND